MKAVEPSEIIIEKGRGEPKEDPLHSNPWLRFLARFFDYSLWIALLWVLHYLLGGGAPFAQYERIIPYEFFTWIPVEAVLLYAWGKTPGKFLLTTTIRQGRRDRLDIGSAFRRSFFVWFRGLGMMIPILNFLCLLVAYQRLKLLHTTTWDRDEHTRITHSPLSRWRMVTAVSTIAFVAIFIYLPKKFHLT